MYICTFRLHVAIDDCPFHLFPSMVVVAQELVVLISHSSPLIMFDLLILPFLFYFWFLYLSYYCVVIIGMIWTVACYHVRLINFLLCLVVLVSWRSSFITHYLMHISFCRCVLFWSWIRSFYLLILGASSFPDSFVVAFISCLVSWLIISAGGVNCFQLLTYCFTLILN